MEATPSNLHGNGNGNGNGNGGAVGYVMLDQAAAERLSAGLKTLMTAKESR